MTASGWLQIVMYGLVVLAITKPLGIYLYRVFEDQDRPRIRGFGSLERWSLRLCGVDAQEEQTWKEYALALLLFSLVGLLVSYLIMRVQQWLPLNPQGLGPWPRTWPLTPRRVSPPTPTGRPIAARAP
jgi:K+-transporting ATPase ATPase A chain